MIEDFKEFMYEDLTKFVPNKSTKRAKKLKRSKSEPHENSHDIEQKL